MPDAQTNPASPRSSIPRPLVVIGLAALLVLGVLTYLLSFGKIPGYPESAQKSVSIYEQAVQNPSGLTLYLHPPLNSIQAAGGSQLLAFQFINRGPATLVNDLQLSSAGCLHFALEPTVAGVQQKSLPVLLAPGQSALYWYRLSVSGSSDSCLGQFPLVFRYTWQFPQKKAGAAPTVEQQSISTGPILVTTPEQIGWQRFFSLTGKIVPLVLLPVLLALGTLLYQHLQEQRAGQQKEQEQKLEVWKTVLPGIIQAIRNHYIPILSVISIMKDETDPDNVLVCALLLRSKVTNLVKTSGGFYFKNRRGEELCAGLSNTFMDRCYRLSKNEDEFRNAAILIPPRYLFAEAKEKMLHISSTSGSTLPNIRTDFAAEIAKTGELAHMKAHLEMIYEILNYEANGPFYPQWYDELDPPDQSKLNIPALGLDQATGQNLTEILNRYLEYLKTVTEKKK